MAASLLVNTGCGGFCPTQRVKGCKIGLQFVYHLILYLCYVLELGFTTLANKDRRTTRLCLLCFLYLIKPHSKHHRHFSSKNSPPTLHITPFPYNLFALFFCGKKTNASEQTAASRINTARSSIFHHHYTPNFLGKEQAQHKLTRLSFYFLM